MQDKTFITNELERLVNLINNTPIKKKKDNEYIHLLDEIVIKARDSLSKIDHELIRKTISKIKDEHMIYLISRDFFKPAPHRNNFLIQLIDTSIIEKTIEHLFHKKSIGEVRLNEYFGVRLVSKFITQSNKSYKKITSIFSMITRK